MLIWHFYEKDSAFDSARRAALVEAKAAARQIDNDSAKLLIAHAIADDLTANRLSEGDIESRLEQELINHPEVTAFTICFRPEFVPNSVSGSSIRHCPSASRSSGQTIIRQRV